jgi:RHS repeat-associated protein
MSYKVTRHDFMPASARHQSTASYGGPRRSAGRFWRREGGPFGEEVSPQYPPPDKRLFTGKERDGETGMDYFEARYLQASAGRFTTVDPLMNQSRNVADPQKWNRYAYVRNNPLRYVDPDGQDDADPNQQAGRTSSPSSNAEEAAKKLAAAQEAARQSAGALLQDKRVKGFLDVTAQAEGGAYDVQFGGGKFTDFSKHPGKGAQASTAAGRYQIVEDTWLGLSKVLGVSDFSPGTQDLMAAKLLQQSGAAKCLLKDDLDGALYAASRTWAALPQGPGLGGRYPPQPYMEYEDFKTAYTGAIK